MSDVSRPAKPAREFRAVAISLLAALTGLIAGLVAYLLYLMIALATNLVFFGRVAYTLPPLADHRLGWAVLVVPALGAFAVALIAKYGSSKIRGHGIPEAMEAVLFNRSRIAPRIAILKPLSAAIAIGTGGPFGAEGPIIQTGGSIGSIIGQIVPTTAAERKVLLGCGAAAGMAATFGTPIAAVIFAIELLLFEFKARSFTPLVIATTLATTMHGMLIGTGPMFHVGHIDFGGAETLAFYAIFGLIAGIGAVALSATLYWIEDRFEELAIDEVWKPVIGGLALGLIGWYEPRVLGVGYDTITAILNAKLALGALAAIASLKLAALLLSLGSGTSGGLLAPTFMIGGAAGGIFALLVNAALPGLHLDPAAFALVGMAALFAAASRATFAFIVFAFEITGTYDAVLPLMLTTVIAAGLARLFMKNSIMTEKLARRGLKVEDGYEVDPFRQATVRDVMDPEPLTVPASLKASELARRIAEGDPSLRGRHGLPIVDADGNLAGIVTRGDLLVALEELRDADDTVLEIGHRDVVVAFPDEQLHDAVERMLARGVGRLPVVSRAEPRRLVGYLGRADVLKARLKVSRHETEVEPGLVSRLAPAGRRG